MTHYSYLIIGGGSSADAAIHAIREIDFTKSICLLSQDKYPPYTHHALSKGLWTGGSIDGIWKHTEKEHAYLQLDTVVTHIDPEQKRVTDQKGQSYFYDQLLIATGSRAQPLKCPAEGVIYFRSLDDYFCLKTRYESSEHFVVIGSGYIGTEIATALRLNGKKITMIFSDPSIGSRIYPKKLSFFLNAYFTEYGIKLIPNQTVCTITQENGKSVVTTHEGTKVIADTVIAGSGILPNIELGEQMGLEIHDGIVVNSYMQTSLPNIYAAGDVANCFYPSLNQRFRTDHEECAKVTGKIAGYAMAGNPVPYDYLPSYTHDIFDLSYEAVGIISSDMEIIEDWVDPYQQGAIYYLKEGRLLGAILWKQWHLLSRVKELIASQHQWKEGELLETLHHFEH